MSRRLLLLLLVFGLARPAFALDPDGNYFVRGVGNDTCGAYLAARAQHNAGAYENWLAGYVTAFDRWTSDVWRLERGDFQSSLDWLDFYCQAHHADTFDMAAQNLTAFLYPNRVKGVDDATVPPAFGSSTPPR